jgi:hypothetical protein
VTGDDQVLDTEAVTLGEIGRLVSDVRSEVRALRGDVVRKDVYDAEQRTADVRIRAVEAQIKAIQDGGTAMRRLVYAALLTAGGGAVVQLVTNVVDHKP